MGGLVTGAGGEGSLPVELIADGGMDGGNHLQTSHLPEPLYGPLPSSERQVGVLRAVVCPLDLPGGSGEHQLRNQEVIYGRREQTDAGVSA